jgi:hypothetical protein
MLCEHLGENSLKTSRNVKAAHLKKGLRFSRFAPSQEKLPMHVTVAIYQRKQQNANTEVLIRDWG